MSRHGRHAAPAGPEEAAQGSPAGLPAGPDGAKAKRRKGPRWRRWLLRSLAVAMALVLVVILGLSLEASLLLRKVERFAIPETVADTPGETWVIVGSDSRADLPEGEDIYTATAVTDVDGDRSDLVLVIQARPGQSPYVFSIPRDLVLPRADSDKEERLSKALEGGRAEVVGALCVGLGIPTDHMVEVTFGGFSRIVDRLGGIEIYLDKPTRDNLSELELHEAGNQTLDGRTALALLRSRHPQYLIDGTWQEVDPITGTAARTANSAKVFEALRVAAKTQIQANLTHPKELHSLISDLAANITADEDVSLWSVIQLGRSVLNPASIVTLEGQTTDTELAIFPNEATYAALEEAGYGLGQCSMAPAE
ncbi:MAG: LCP family protein [Bifidobacteriaceae bacterium]|jgi:LCP family protein required for cell wall assembly|nr:LCP family protein [Bifidobacteriaceae bacterium]